MYSVAWTLRSTLSRQPEPVSQFSITTMTAGRIFSSSMAQSWKGFLLENLPQTTSIATTTTAPSPMSPPKLVLQQTGGAKGFVWVTTTMMGGTNFTSPTMAKTGFITTNTAFSEKLQSRLELRDPARPGALDVLLWTTIATGWLI